MADVFLSYAREDVARAQQVAQGLGQAGLEVFWDNEIPPGTTWADYIEQKLTQCKVLIVLWSEHSTKSQWVREEARMGRDKGVLIPVMIDTSQAPFGFGEVQAANLANWTGDLEDAHWKRFVNAVTNFSQAAPPPPVAPATAPQQPAWTTAAPAAAEAKKGGVPIWAWIAGGVVGVLVILGIIGSVMPDDPQVAENTPQQVAANPTQPAASGVNYQQQILDRLGQVEQAFVSQGFQRLAEPVSGQLPQGQFYNTPVTLEAGGEYRIIGVCDSDCADMNLILYDQNNNVVSQDILQDATPIVSVAPQWTGPFTVQAVMQNCTVQPCYYALVLYGRPMQP